MERDPQQSEQYTSEAVRLGYWCLVSHEAEALANEINSLMNVIEPHLIDPQHGANALRHYATLRVMIDEYRGVAGPSWDPAHDDPEEGAAIAAAVDMIERASPSTGDALMDDLKEWDNNVSAWIANSDSYSVHSLDWNDWIWQRSPHHDLDPSDLTVDPTLPSPADLAEAAKSLNALMRQGLSRAMTVDVN